MRKASFVTLLVLICLSLHSQYTYTINADSVRITNNCGTDELILENSTRNIQGFLFNKGGGRTEFRKAAIKLNDSSYLLGADTVSFNVPPYLKNAFVNNGNAFGTNAILGTNDNNPLSIYTNNAERIKITSNGNIGIGTSNPTAKLHIQENNNAGGMAFPYETLVVENPGDHKVGIYSSASDLTQGGVAVTMGYTNKKDANGYYPGYEMQFGGFSNSQYFLRFNSLKRNAAGIVSNSYQYILVLDDAGRAGINLSNGSGMFVAPSANLHVNGSVRLQNLPYGNGCPLVIDSSGNIYQTDCSGQAAALQSTGSKTIIELQNKINALEGKIQNLLTEIESLTNNVNNLQKSTSGFTSLSKKD